MTTSIKNSEFHLANRSEKSIVVKIIVESFRNDPQIAWLVEKSKNKNKLEVIADYVVDQSFEKGQVYITNDNFGAALWHTQKKEKITLVLIKRNLVFFYKLGLLTVIRNLKFVKISHRHFPKNKQFFYLYLIGVMPERQGKGLASKLMNPVLDYCKLHQLPVFLETANQNNIEIYKKKGFEITDNYNPGSITINFMRLKN